MEILRIAGIVLILIAAYVGFIKSNYSLAYKLSLGGAFFLALNVLI